MVVVAVGMYASTAVTVITCHHTIPVSTGASLFHSHVPAHHQHGIETIPCLAQRSAPLGGASVVATQTV